MGGMSSPPGRYTVAGEVTAGGGGGGSGWRNFLRVGRGGWVPCGCGRPCDHQRQASYENVEVPQIQFIVIVLDIPVGTQRRLPTVMTPVVVQRLVPGRGRAENCGGSAVPVL